MSTAGACCTKSGLRYDQTVIFSTTAGRHKKLFNYKRILNLPLKSDFNKELLNFNTGFASY